MENQPPFELYSFWRASATYRVWVVLGLKERMTYAVNESMLQSCPKRWRNFGTIHSEAHQNSPGLAGGSGMKLSIKEISASSVSGIRSWNTRSIHSL